jgi:hypothetical protein
MHWDHLRSILRPHLNSDHSRFIFQSAQASINRNLVANQEKLSKKFQYICRINIFLIFRTVHYSSICRNFIVYIFNRCQRVDLSISAGIAKNKYILITMHRNTYYNVNLKKDVYLGKKLWGVTEESARPYYGLLLRKFQRMSAYKLQHI